MHRGLNVDTQKITFDVAAYGDDKQAEIIEKAGDNGLPV